MDQSVVDWLAELIWRTSRDDEGTISATGANIIASAIAVSGWPDSLQARAWDEGWEVGLDGLTHRGTATNPYRD